MSAIRAFRAVKRKIPTTRVIHGQIKTSSSPWSKSTAIAVTVARPSVDPQSRRRPRPRPTISRPKLAGTRGAGVELSVQRQQAARIRPGRRDGARSRAVRRSATIRSSARAPSPRRTARTRSAADHPPIGNNKTIGPLDRVRVDSTNQRADHQPGRARSATTRTRSRPACAGRRCSRTSSSARRSPTSITSGFPSASSTPAARRRTATSSATSRSTQYTRASLFSEAGKQTPVFVRFSTVLGERGSTDTARDVRGFAVKFYTDEGNWDLVGNNIPIFFIQDAMKFPDLVHAAKPEPHFAMPQAGTAHDTFWDFASLMPEITAMLMWAMSDRAIPRSYRTMQGFGVHTFRLVNAAGESHFVKFHWTPLAGTHSLVWDEAVKISGADPDFHRRDLWEAIEAGAYPEWELGLQIFTEEQAEGFTFDVLDATKIVPEELVPIMPVGKLVLNRNPDNFFAETEQVAFCTAHVVPGHRLHQRSAAGGTDPLLRRHPDLASRRPEFPRDSDQRADRPGPQQPTRRHAPSGDQSRPRRLRAELARRRLPVPGRRGRASCRFRSRWSPRRTRSAARPSGSPITTPRRRCSGTARRRSRRRTSSTPSASSCRGCRRRRCASGWCRG